MQQETIFTLQTKANTYYIDIDREENFKPYKVFTNEKFRKAFEKFGDALEFVFEKQGNIDFYSKSYLEALNNITK